jgi:hypothetical protein
MGEVRSDRLAAESASKKLLTVQNPTTGLMKILFAAAEPSLGADIIFEEQVIF